MGEKGYYTYCVLKNNDVKLPGIKGIDNKNMLELICFNGIGAVVSKVSLDEYGEDTINSKTDDLVWLNEKAVLHMNIIQNIMSGFTLIPLRFCTIFVSRENVINLLENNYEVFVDGLNFLENREEWSVKVYCNIDVFMETQMKEERIKIEQTASDKTKGAAYFYRKQMGNMLKEKAEDKLNRLIKSLYEELGELAVQSVSNKLLAKEITGVNDKMCLNCALLIDIENRNTMQDKISNVRQEYLDRGITVEYSGPWPPYNFCPVISQS